MTLRDAGMLEARTQELFEEQQNRVRTGANQVFFWLLIGQWAFAIFISLVWSPYGWEGKVRSTHVHVPAAFVIGAVLNSLPLLLLKLRPHETYTRHIVTVSQMLWSALLIHLTGGRIETHFHVFGSLAFLAFYRDWRLFVTATLVVSADHLARGVLWPESVYGISNPEWWRFLEHAFWVVFEDVILVMACLRAVAEMEIIARGRAEVEAQQNAVVRSEKAVAIGSLAATVGHELRNPLASVKGAMGYINKRVAAENDPKLHELLGVVERELASCSRIITDLLDFARERPLLRGPAPMRALVADAFAAVPSRPGVTLVNSVPADLPVPSVDKAQFAQVIGILIANSVEAIAEKGTVDVGASWTPSGWAIWVNDDGAGIPAAAIGKVMQPLYTTKTNRMGLGLSIAQTTVERHGGTLAIASEPGKGTTVTMTLPAAVAQKAAA